MQAKKKGNENTGPAAHNFMLFFPVSMPAGSSSRTHMEKPIGNKCYLFAFCAGIHWRTCPQRAAVWPEAHSQ
eukprot:1148663-Pelagomonas_calceolata.AAC.3